MKAFTERKCFTLILSKQNSDACILLYKNVEKQFAQNGERSISIGMPIDRFIVTIPSNK